jgi:hypothetical protein
MRRNRKRNSLPVCPRQNSLRLINKDRQWKWNERGGESCRDGLVSEDTGSRQRFEFVGSFIRVERLRSGLELKKRAREIGLVVGVSWDRYHTL